MTQPHTSTYCPQCKQRVRSDGSGLESELREHFEKELTECKWVYNGALSEYAAKQVIRDSQTRTLEAEVSVLRDALLNADRYFKAKSGEYFCDVGLCETAASYAVDKALTQTRAPSLLEVVKAADELGISDAVWEDDRISWVEVQIDKRALKQFDEALKKYQESK